MLLDVYDWESYNGDVCTHGTLLTDLTGPISAVIDQN